jgi:hypothetical protein
MSRIPSRVGSLKGRRPQAGPRRVARFLAGAWPLQLLLPWEVRQVMAIGLAAE